MSGYFTGDFSQEPDPEQLALGWLDPKGEIRTNIAYFKDRSTELASPESDENAMTEGNSDYWVFRDAEFQEACLKEIKAFHTAVRAVTKFIAANRKTESTRKDIEDRVTSMLQASEAIAASDVITDGDFEQDCGAPTDDQPQA